LLGVDQSGLIEVTQDHSGASIRNVAGREPMSAYLRFANDNASGVAEVIASGRTLALTDALTSPSLSPGAAEHQGIASAILAPIRWGGEVRAVLAAGWSERHEITPADVELAELVCDQAAAGLSRLEAEARYAAGAVQDRAVVRAANALTASLELQEVLLALVHEAALAMSADFAGVHLGDDAGAVSTSGYNAPDGWQGKRHQPGQGIVGRVLATGAPVLDHDYGADGLSAALAVPMVWNGQLRGVLSLGWEERRRVHDDDMRTIEAIAGLATLACRNAEAFERVQHIARTDALTGVLNHGAMQLRVREEIARARRDKAPLGVVILDLDDFKQVNDTRGHAAGDELLRRVATLLQAELRPYDQVARYGGDEFVLLLPGSDEATTAAVAERCRDAIGGQCSIGVAAWQDGLDADGLLEQADRALMLAKRTGKGRVAVANPEVERELALLQSRSGSPAAVQALAAAIEERDNYTHEHSERVVHLSRGVAMILGLQADDVEKIAHAALLHDVGKLAMPPELLDKRGPLSPEEWEIMTEHPIAGERILMRTKDLAGLAPIVRHEHEHFDGTGYPDGLAGHRIPVGSRIILACDAYMAMTSPRPYREALPPAAAVAELRANAGRKFDPDIVDALLDLLGHNPPQVPDRAAGVKLAASPPREPAGRRAARSWAPGG
jgi:diguanylate cyclase (GGDEF)-like protein